MGSDKPLKLYTRFAPLTLIFAWVWPLIFHIRRAEKAKDIKLELQESEESEPNSKLICGLWDEEFKKNGSESSILNVLIRAYGVIYGLTGIWKVLWGGFTWIGAYYFLKRFLNYLSFNESESTGQKWAIAILISSLASSVSIHQLYIQSTKIGVRVRAGLSGLIYRKALRIASTRGGSGEVMNLIANDVSRIVLAVTEFHNLWSAFSETIVIIALMAAEIKECCVPAVVIILVLLPVQYYLGKLTNDTQMENAKLNSERVHLMTEILTAIKLIKFYAWETPYSEKISSIRERELKILYRGMIVKSINFAVVFATPCLSILFCLIMYWKLDYPITSTVVFVVVSVLNTLRYPLLNLPLSVRSTSGAYISFSAITRFLLLTEVKPIDIKEPPANNPDLAFEIKNADFTWDGETVPAISNITLKGKRGQLIGIVGDVGSGKSSLISAIMGQIHQTAGDVNVYGHSSYVPQEAWILGNQTLRDNILFGKEYNKERYDEVIRVAGLQRDLTLLAAGDLTEMAERGANLSGGQKHRVSLARAVYNGSDIILLDSPLAALDQNVGRHIFEECFLKDLKEKGRKCVLLIMHQLQFLPQTDYIVVVNKGKISQSGTYEELSQDASFREMVERHISANENDEMEDEDEEEDKFMLHEAMKSTSHHEEEKFLDGPMSGGLSVGPKHETVRSFRQLSEQDRESLFRRRLEENALTVRSRDDRFTSIHDYIRRQEDTVHSLSADIFKADASFDDKEDDELSFNEEMPMFNLIQEDRSGDALGIKNYAQYFESGRGTFITIIICIFFFLVHGIRIFSDYWLRMWVPNTLNVSSPMYMGIYGLLVVAFTFGVLCRGIAFAWETAKKAGDLHDKMFRRIMRAPQGFFDSTPLARILAAVSKHQSTIDDTCPDYALQCLQYAPLALGAILIIAIVIPFNYGPVIGLVIISAVFAWWVGPADTKLKQLEAITKPPLMSHITNTMEGLFSIRAYGAQQRFNNMAFECLDTNDKALYAHQLVKSWLAFNIDIITSIMIYCAALFLVLFNGRMEQAASDAGFALSNALQLLVFLQWTIRMLGDINGHMGSVGQVYYYGSEAVPQEAAAIIPETQPSKEWPVNPTIEFKDVVLRYQENGVDVLKKVNFKVKATEKVGLVGRTGSGKSTLLVALLRIVELREGQILIDGIDISKLGLDTLRRTIAIIPQESVLFVGSIKSNLDPFNCSTDEEIWAALENVNLAESIRALPEKLDAPVAENGSNYSLGQRQLFCIARAILSKAKILVLDEASSALDLDTDAFIQKTIRQCFKDLTVLTVAHRLNTIIDSDKVLLMDGGCLLEFDEPINLLNDTNSSFYDLVSHSGPAATRKLIECAQEAHDDRVKLGVLPPDSEKKDVKIQDVESKLQIAEMFEQPPVIQVNDASYANTEDEGDDIDEASEKNSQN